MTLTDTFLIVNGAACVAYFLLFTVVLRELIRNAKDYRSRAAIFITCIFPLLIGMFFGNFIFEIMGEQSSVQSFYYYLVPIPAVLIFLFRKNIFDLKTESTSSVKRFNELKDEFLTVASHELRTPLSVINGFAEILVREKLGTLNDEQKRRVRKILMQAQRLNRIIDNLLDLSRIRSGKLGVKKDVFDMVPVLKACLDDHQIVCDQQGIELCDEISDVLPDVVGDLDRVTQVIVNLLSNGFKYTPFGGKITVRAFHDQKEDCVRVEVQDTGIGIDPQDQAKIFHEFYRATDQHARKYAGSGLGLAIVKQLVETQSGRVGVHSEGLGKGSLFYFTMPIATGRLKSQGLKTGSA